MTVSDNTIEAEGLGNFFKNLCFKKAKMMVKKNLRNLDDLSKIGATVASALASRSPKAALSSLPEVINFYHT